MTLFCYHSCTPELPRFTWPYLYALESLWDVEIVSEVLFNTWTKSWSLRGHACAGTQSQNCSPKQFQEETPEMDCIRQWGECNFPVSNPTWPASLLMCFKGITAHCCDSREHTGCCVPSDCPLLFVKPSYLSLSSEIISVERWLLRRRGGNAVTLVTPPALMTVDLSPHNLRSDCAVPACCVFALCVQLSWTASSCS